MELGKQGAFCVRFACVSSLGYRRMRACSSQNDTLNGLSHHGRNGGSLRTVRGWDPGGHLHFDGVFSCKPFHHSSFPPLFQFTGWYDCPLSPKGHEEVIEAGQLIKKEGLVADVAYTSLLQRAIRTLWHVLEQTGLMWIPVNKKWELNERHYGACKCFL